MGTSPSKSTAPQQASSVPTPATPLLPKPGSPQPTNPESPQPTNPVVTPSSNVTPETSNNQDYTILPLCFGKPFNEPLGMSVDAVKKFEYMLYIGAEASRLAYCDVGILKMSLTKAFGLSPDILNKVITHYDWKYLSQKRMAERDNLNFTAPESYQIEPCKTFENDNKKPIARYISSPTDTTCCIIHPSTLKPNDNSIIKDTDCILVFKGSSSLRNWEKNIGSALSSTRELANAISNLGLVDVPSGIKVASSFVTPIVEIFEQIILAINQVTPNCTRIFVFGHSKGGAEAELAGSMLSLVMGKFSLPNVKQVHIISYGAPRVIDPASLKAYNDAFFVKNNGNFTFTRVESRGSLKKGDLVTHVPMGLTHPGTSDDNTTLDSIRTTYAGLPATDNKRNPATWPFKEDIKLWDTGLFSKNPALEAAVKAIIGETPGGEEPKGDGSMQPTNGGERSNYLKVRGSRWTPNPHMEYFGMFFMGSQRLLGMINPAKTQGDRKPIEGSNVNKIFVANIFPECTKYMYVPWTSLGTSTDILKNLLTGKGRRTRRRKGVTRKRKYRR